MSLVTLAALLVVLSPQKSVDLPIRSEIRCEGLGVGANSDAGLVGMLGFDETGNNVEAPLTGALATCWRLALGCVGETDRARSPACPFVKPVSTTGRLTGRLDRTVLDNLQSLEKARMAYKDAETQRRGGHLILAAQIYEKVMRLCPGSRYDELATERLHDVYVQLANESVRTTAEEQDRTPPRRRPRD